MACFINKANHGIRLIFPIYPFLFVIAGYATRLCTNKNFKKASSAIIVLLLLYLAMVAWNIFPNNMAYFNELAGREAKTYKLLGDSNIEWGQDIKKLKRYIDSNNVRSVTVKTFAVSPLQLDYFAIPYKPITEEEKSTPRKGVVYVLGAMALQKGDILWAQDRKPDAEVGKTLKVYYIQ